MSESLTDLKEYVHRLSDQLIILTQKEPRTKELKMQMDALRSLGATEQMARLPSSSVTLDLKRSRPKPAPRAVSPRSQSTRANKTTKMMAGRVLSAYKNRKIKKDGTPLYLSYLQSLENFLEENPEVADLHQVKALYRQLGTN